jgi:uncharacterized membrane-anchored protein YhcB (DUF1043 family)
VYGLEWLIVWSLIGLAGGIAIGVALARRGSGRTADRARQLESDLAASRRELDAYRQEVMTQFGETARRFQTLNDAYTELHQQLAKSSSVLCGDLGGTLLEAPRGHQDLIPASVRNGAPAQGDQQPDATPAGSAAPPPRENASAGDAAAAEGAAPAAQPAAAAQPTPAAEAAAREPLVSEEVVKMEAHPPAQPDRARAASPGP